jgi:hypothetical protein
MKVLKDRERSSSRYLVENAGVLTPEVRECIDRHIREMAEGKRVVQARALAKELAQECNSPEQDIFDEIVRLAGQLGVGLELEAADW